MTRTKLNYYDAVKDIAIMMTEDDIAAAEVIAVSYCLQRVKASIWEQERLSGQDLGSRTIGNNSWTLEKVALYMEEYLGDTSRDFWTDEYRADAESDMKLEILDLLYRNCNIDWIDERLAEAHKNDSYDTRAGVIYDDEPEPETTTSETVFHYYDEACEFLADALGLQEEPYDRSWWIADPSALLDRGDDPVDVKVDMGRLVNLTCDARLDEDSELEELVFLYDMTDPAEADLVLDLMWTCSEIVEEETIPEIDEDAIIDYDDGEIRFIIERNFGETPDDYDMDGIRDAIAYADEDGELFYVPGCWDESGRATEKLHAAIRRHRRS